MPNSNKHDSSSSRDADERTPGASGRPMKRRETLEQDEIDTSYIAARPDDGGNSGGTRSPKILQKNRKIRRAA